MMKKRISDRSNLIFRVYVIGYSVRGESILILFADKGEEDRIIYSIVIDSFKYKGEHKTLDIMNEYNLKEKKLDMLIWSHPDYDHTYGLNEIINNYCSENTQVVLPYDLNGKAWNKVDYNKEDKNLVDKILKLTERKYKSHDTANASDYLYHPLVDITLEDGLGILPISVWALSPHSTRINYLLEKHATMHKNDLSISLMVGIGKDNANKFLFFADVENDDVDLFYPQAFEEPHFVKIPHHGSSSSDLLPKKLVCPPTKLPVACVTIYKSQKLPEIEVLQKYCSIFQQVDCTGRSNAKTVNYGYAQYDFDLYDTQQVSVKHYGHAKTVDSQYLKDLGKLIPQKVNQ